VVVVGVSELEAFGLLYAFFISFSGKENGKATRHTWKVIN
jgi:hypothetical protein